MGAYIAIALLNARSKVDEFQLGGGRKGCQRKSRPARRHADALFQPGHPCLYISHMTISSEGAGSFPGKSKGRHLRSSLFSQCDLGPGVAQGVEQTSYLIKV